VIRNPKAILALLTALNLLNYLDRFVLSAVLKPLQEDLQLSNFVGGFLATMFLLGYFVTSPVFGAIGDRSGKGGRKALVVVGALIWSVATMATGLAHGAPTILLARAIVGVGEASFVTIAPTIIDDIAPPEKKSAWLSYFFTAIPVGSAIGYLVGGAVQHATHDWRMSFFVAGGPGILLGLLCLLMKEPDANAPRATAVNAKADASVASGSRRGAFADARTLSRIPLYFWVVAGQCAYTFAIVGFGYWAPKYVALRYSMEDGRAAFLFGLVTVVGGFVGTLVGGRIGDIVSRRHASDEGVARGNLALTAVATGIAVPFAAVCLVCPTALVFFAMVLPCEIALFVPGGPYNVAVLRSVPPALRTTGMALSIFASHLFGDLWSPPLIGLVADHVSMAWAMLVVPATFALASFFWWRGKGISPHRG
jgi:MFS family permease